MTDENPYASPRIDSDKSVREGNAVIRVTRTTSYADRIRAYRIVVDGQEVARLNAGEAVDIPVVFGRHSLVAKIDWCSSPTLNCSVDGGDTVQFECGSNLRGLRIVLALFYVIFQRNRYLTLTQSSP